MPGGNASKNSTSAKPNTNTNGTLDDAADNTLDPYDVVDDRRDSTRLDEAPENAAATQRPEKK